MQSVNLDWLVWVIALPVVIGVPILVFRLIKGGPSAVLAGSRVLETVFEVALPTQRSSHKATLRVNRLANKKNPVQVVIHTRSRTSKAMSSLTFAADGAQLLAEHVERELPLATERVQEEEVGRAKPKSGFTVRVYVGGDWARPVALRIGPKWAANPIRLTVSDAQKMSAALRYCVEPGRSSNRRGGLSSESPRESRRRSSTE